MSSPFDYPPRPHVRRHGPAGYADYGSYRPWLRDEFAFRCVFCLRREVWGRVVAEFAIDHFEPVANRPDRVTEYDNLLYACGTCNARKGDQFVADPLTELVAGAVAVGADGALMSRTRQARRIVRVLQLDGPEMTEYRAMWMDVIRLAATHDPDLYQRLLGYPADLPDLGSLRPPGGNSRTDGTEQSHFRRRERGDLPATY